MRTCRRLVCAGRLKGELEVASFMAAARRSRTTGSQSSAAVRLCRCVCMEVCSEGATKQRNQQARAQARSRATRGSCRRVREGQRRAHRRKLRRPKDTAEGCYLCTGQIHTPACHSRHRTTTETSPASGGQRRHRPTQHGERRSETANSRKKTCLQRSLDPAMQGKREGGHRRISGDDDERRRARPGRDREGQDAIEQEEGMGRNRVLTTNTRACLDCREVVGDGRNR